MSGKYFPIKSDTACRSKWSWSTVYLNSGRTGSCHRASLSDIEDDFDNFHNTSSKLAARKLMLEGHWPGGGCEYCQQIESSGGSSDRMFQNQIPDIYPPELDVDTTQIEVQPVVLEIFFKNTCNLKCVYCSAKYSSAIQLENKKFNGAILDNLNFNYNENRYNELVPKFWNWLEKNSNNLLRLQVLGGEPFLLNDVELLIDHYDANPNPKLEFNLVTNLSLQTHVINQKLNRLVDLKKANKIKRIDIQASIDCWGSEQEYIRDGLNVELFEENILSMISSNEIKVGLLTTINSLSIPSMMLLVEKYLEWNKINELCWYMHIVIPEDNILSPFIFDYTFYEPFLNKIKTTLPLETWNQKQTYDTFTGLMKTLEKYCQTDISRQAQLVNYLNKNDQRRNSNWRKTFPWMAKELENVV